MKEEAGTPDQATLATIQALYDRQLFLRAWAAAESCGPIEGWTGTAARILAGRLANRLGAVGLGRRLILRAWRHDPDNWTARAYVARVVGELRGPWAVWERLREWGDPPESESFARCEVSLVRAWAAAAFRDFETADRCLADADATRSDRAWCAAERAMRLRGEDRHADALATVEAALAGHPHHVALSMIGADCLQLLGREREALALLRATLGQADSYHVASMLYLLEADLDGPERALDTLARLEQVVPIAEPPLRAWIAGARAHCLHRLGRPADAARWARSAGDDPWTRGFAERLESPPPGARRVRLEVSFVPQHHLTCAPATLTALSRFWGRAAEHLDVADAICYDGTSWHASRSWAEQNGWTVREFRVTAASARALIDRGIPFMITTFYAGGSHALAVIGYDDIRGTLLIRDPSERGRHEMDEQELAAQAANGPRGMVMVPAGKAALLEGEDLPEAGLYDLLHATLHALDAHRREAAVRSVERLEQLAPGQRLAIEARRALASYDSDPVEILSSIDRLLGLHPDDVNLQLARLGCLRDLVRPRESLEMLRAACARPDSEPILWQELARELARDARHEPEALRWLDRAQRLRRPDAAALTARADILWDRGERTSAYGLYRFAACLDDRKEGYAVTWFRAARWLERHPEVIEALAQRARRTGAASSLPARTLVWAYLDLDDTSTAESVLAAQLERFPEDGPLLIFAVGYYTDAGDPARAASLLKRARTRSAAGPWRRAAARVACSRGDPARELTLWREILEAEPLAMDAHAALTRLLAETQGRAAALAHLDGSCRRFPHYLPLLDLRVEWMRDDGPAAVEAVARELLAVHPESAWARRELARALVDQGRFAEADEQLDAAAVREPTSLGLFNIRGVRFAREGRLAEARAQFAEALRLSIDNVFAMRWLVQCCLEPRERAEALDLIRGELARQTTLGDGVLSFADVARPFVPADELVALVRDVHSARPDLWQSWSALSSRLVAQGRHEEAAAVAREAAERFPLVPRLWVDLGLAHRARLDHAAAIEALEQAHRLNPTFGPAARELATALEAAGRLEDARLALEHAVKASNLDAITRGCLADVLWKLREKEPALAQVREAVLLDPDYEWAWEQLDEWGRALGRADTAREMAEELTRRRPGEARSWLILARMLGRDQKAQLAALKRAMALDPRHVAAHRLKIEVLAQAGRHAEALAACDPPGFGGTPPPELRVAAAWVLAQQGEVPEAIRRLREVLADHPHLEQGWQLLALWHEERHEFDEAVKAAEAIARLRPLDPMPLGYAGDLKLRRGQLKGAEADFRRAFELAPDYTFAAFHLFDLQLKREDLKGAGGTLARMRGHVSAPALLERELKLAVAARDRARALAVVGKLCAEPEDDEAAFARAAEALGQERWGRKAERIARDALRSPAANPSAARLWVELRLSRGKIENLGELLRLPEGTESARRALARQIDALAERYKALARKGWLSFWIAGYLQLWRLLRKRGAWLRRDNGLWGRVGYLQLCRNRSRDVIRWLEDWRDRPDVEPWMLVNLLVALQGVGKDAEAEALIRDARALPRRRVELARFDLFHALREACSGSPESGQRVIDRLAAPQLSSYDQHLLELLKIAVTFARDDGAAPAFGEAVSVMRKASAATRGSRGARKAIGEVVRLVARRTGRSGAGRWLLWLRVFFHLA